MTFIDNKIPPPIIAAICAAFAWQISQLTPELTLLWEPRMVVAIAIGLLGLTLDIVSLLAFRRADTTFNPLSPEKANTVVHEGIYRLTRNPMYLGLALILFSFCIYLGNPLSILAVIAFIAYITRFQIIPEERALTEKFGQSYTQYRNSVRRWI